MIDIVQGPQRAVSFGPFRLMPAERRLERDGAVVRLGSRALDLLIALAERPGDVVGKETLLARAWPDLTVDESSLRFHIVGLRKALGLDASGQPFVINVPGRGYCLVAPVHPAAPTIPAAPQALAAMVRSLPQPLERMVGRQGAVDHIHTCLSRHRFVTIHGAGGVGKTTVAVAVAHRHLDVVGEPVVFVDLASLREPTLVASTIASMLGVVAQSDDATPEVIDYLRDQHLLVVLDCCEHVIDAVAGFVERIYLEAPHVTLLVTSRERLRVEGEYVVPLAPLDFVPIETGASAAQLLAPPAAQLLIQRIAAAGYGQDITEDDAGIIAEICQRLDGNALAIELVASRVASHGLRDTALLLGGRLQLFWPGRRTASPRHQTLQSALDWSHDLLSDLSRRVFRRLSVFVGPFDLDSALDVAADDTADRDAVVVAMDDLVAKSLLAVRQESHGARYRLLDLPCSYARQKLDESGEAAATATRHAAAMLSALSRRPATADAGGRRTHARTLLGDLHGALFWSFGGDGDRSVAVPLAAAACEVFTELSLLNESVRWSRRALEALGDDVDPIGAAVVLHATLGNALMFTEGNDDLARAALERALALAGEMGDRENQFRLLTRLHMCQRRRGEIAQLLPTSERLMWLARQIDMPVAIAAAHTQFAVARHLAGDQPAARGHIEIAQHLDLFRSVAPEHFAFHRNPSLALARCLWLQGAPDAALAMARPLIEDAPTSDVVTYCITLIWAAAVFRWAGDHDTVQRVAERLSAHARSHSLRPYQAVGLALQGEGLVGAGQTAVGLALLRSAVASLHAAQYELYTPGFEATIARALVSEEDVSSAAALLDGTLRRVRADGETCELPDLLRLRASLCLRQGQQNEAATRLAEAMAMAQRQGALAWQLRIAADQLRLARLSGPATHEAATLATVYSMFQDGFASADLVAARALLAEAGVAVDPAVEPRP